MLNRKSLAAICMIYLVASLSIGWGQTSRTLRDRIPKPDPEKYHNIRIRNSKDWKNPYLVVLPDGIEVLGVTQAGHPIATESVAGVLETLPDSAWPYGLVVAVQDNGIVSQEDAARIQANRIKLVELLGKEGVSVDFWPSA